MRVRLIFACLFAGAALATPTSAQSPLDGPLAAPDAPAAKPEAATPHAKPKPKKARHAAARPTDATSRHASPVDESGRDPPTSAPAADTPVDPLSLGMKWQGNNDSAAQTRSQNLNGGAFGSGAEVGMKLHF